MKKSLTAFFGFAFLVSVAYAQTTGVSAPPTQIMPAPLRKIEPPVSVNDGSIIQFDNLTISSISGTSLPATIYASPGYAYPMSSMGSDLQKSPAPMTGKDIKCYMFSGSDAAIKTETTCPQPAGQETSSGSAQSAQGIQMMPPTVLPYQYRIQVSQDTRLMLRNRETATLSDFVAGNQINVYGYYNADGTVRALVVRNLSKPEEKRFIQLNNVNVVSVSGNAIPADIVVVQRDYFPCYDFGARGDMKRPYPCPAGLKSFDDNPTTRNLNAPESLMPIINTGRKYIVRADAGTIFLNREKVRISLSDISVGDELNVYGAIGNQTEIIEADIIRNLSKPPKPVTPEQIRGTITQVNSDGSFMLQMEDGRVITVKNPFQVGASVSVKGILDGISGILSNISEILIKSRVPEQGTVKIRTSSELQGVVGKYFNALFEASGGSTPYEFSVSAGILPPGLTLQKPTIACIQAPCPQPSPTSIFLQGTPTSAGTYKFQITAKDSLGNTGSGTFAAAVRSDSTSPSGPTILNISPASGPVGTKVTLTGSGLYTAGGGGALFRNDIFFNDTLIWPSVNFSKDGTKLEFEVTGPTSCNPPLGCSYVPLSRGEYAVYILNGIGRSNSVMFTVTQ